MITEEKELTSIYKGGESARWVAQEIQKRWGDAAVMEYNPRTNCFTFNGWKQRGYHVRKGEKAIISHTFLRSSKEVKKEDGTSETKFSSFPKNVFLFYHLQVEKNA